MMTFQAQTPTPITTRLCPHNLHPQQRIMDVLEKINRPVTVAELAIGTGLSQTTMRKHITLLVERSVVTRSTTGRTQTFQRAGAYWHTCDCCAQVFHIDQTAGMIGDPQHDFDWWLLEQIHCDVAEGFCEACQGWLERKLDRLCPD